MNEQRQIVCVYPWLQLGGADKFNLDMLGQLRRRGWRITIATTLPAAHNWRAAFEPLAEQIADLGAAPPAEQPARLVQLIAARQPDVVLISHSSLAYAALPLLRAHLPQVAFADYCHIEEPGWRDGGYPRMSLAQARLLDMQIVSSQHLKGWMCARGGDPGRIAVCTTNIDAADWDAARYDRAALRAALGLPPGALAVLFAARLERQKQPMLLARVMRAVAARWPNVYFLVAGDGLFAPYLRRSIQRHGLGARMQLLGAVSNARVRELLACSDAFLLPSQHEGISLAIYEAMAMGVAPVSAAVGGQAELVTPACGVLVPRGRGEGAAYVRAIGRLAAQPALAHELGAAARARVAREFPLDAMGARMDALLRGAIAHHHEHPPQALGRTAAVAAARAAVAVAEEDAVAFGAPPPHGARSRLRALYWQQINRGAWWLVPLADQARAVGRALRRLKPGRE